MQTLLAFALVCLAAAGIGKTTAAVQANQEPMITGDDALRILRILDAAYESNQTGQRVTVRS